MGPLCSVFSINAFYLNLALCSIWLFLPIFLQIEHQTAQLTTQHCERTPHCSHSFSNKTAVSSVKDNIYHGMVQIFHSGKQTKQGNTVVKSIARNTITLSNGTHCLSRAHVHIFPHFLCPIHDYWNQITVRSAIKT